MIEAINQMAKDDYILYFLRLPCYFYLDINRFYPFGHYVGTKEVLEAISEMAKHGRMWPVGA